MKLFQEKGVWAPQTPAKSIPARQGPVSIPASHEGGKFSFGSSQDTTYFNATTSPDSIDAAQALKGPSGNSQLGAFSTPSENGDAMGRHKDNIGLNKQPRKKARRKKYWPKVLLEAKPKKIPKPSTPKPRTPKPSKHVTSKRFSNEKRKDAGKESLHATTEPSKHVLETTRRALNFNAIDKGKRGGLIIHQYQRRKWRQSTHTPVVETGAANDGQAINQTGCCNNISLKVYQRRFRFNQCPSSSRKLGPNFPRMWKKRRSRRRKATILPTCSAIADCGGLVPSNWGRMISPTKSQSWSAVNDPNLFKCVLALTPLAKSKKQRSNKSTRKLNLAATILPTSISATNSSRRCCSAIGDCGGLVTSYWGRRISPSKSQSWSTVNYPNPFKCVLSLTPLATPKKKRSNKSIQRLHLGSATLIPCCNQLLSAPIPQSLHVSVWNRDMLLADIENMVTKRQYRMAFLRNAESDHDKVEGCPEFSTRKSLQDVFSIALTDVVERLEGLHISDAGGQLVVLNENAHGKVGEQRAVILYNPKKRKPLPKVNIDQETMRVWKLLMANGGEDVEEERDEDKEKWWEEQRKIFRGRVDSFISRMHLIQGDRRFSPWKGSVVDSVVGVFLTQNVSDHLSSSAFMSLAAKYPLRSTTDNKACDEDAEIVESQESVASNVRAVVQDDFLRQDFNDSLVDEDPHSTIERSSGCSEILHPKDATCIQEFSTFENGDLSGKESLVDSSISREMENGKQGSSSNSLFDLIGAPASVCSFRSQKQNSDIPLTPCDLEVESRNILAEVSSTMMKDAGEISKNLGCMESCGSVCSDAIVDQMASPRDQEATVELRASLSKCQVLPECSSQAEVNQAKGQHSSKTDQEGSNIILQTKAPLRKKKSKVEEKQEKTIDWDEWRKTHVGGRIETTSDAMDSLDWEGVRQAKVDEVADAIKGRGQHRVLAERIKDFLDRVLRDHGSINLEWLRAVPPDKAKEYLLSFKGLGLKSVECVRLLTLHHHAFPVDTNVGRVAVRLGWVPLQPLPESLQIHLLEQYPLMDTIQVYLWPRLCTLDQRTLYELHYQMITFGKVFCRKRKPNCHVCPLRGECRHFASEFASARLALPGPQGKNTDSSIIPLEAFHNSSLVITPATNSSPEATFPESRTENCEPIIEHPPSPEPESTEYLERDIEDLFNEDEDCIPTIRLDAEEFKGKIQEFIDLNNIPLEEGDMSRALVALTSLAASMPVPKLKDISRLRTVHHVYEIPDSHCILAGFDKREPCDPSPYLLAIWTSGGTAISSKLPRKLCDSSQGSNPCNEDRCSSCNNSQDENLQTVRGTILIPCRTATRGTFPLNGTYFQVNEVFADDETSEHPLNVPRAWIWQLRRRSLHCGAYAGAIFRGLSTEQIQSCFWRGFVCVRGFNRKTREPAHLAERFHVSTITKGKRKFTQDE